MKMTNDTEARGSSRGIPSAVIEGWEGISRRFWRDAGCAISPCARGWKGRRAGLGSGGNRGSGKGRVGFWAWASGVFLAAGLLPSLQAADPFAALVRPTGPLTPAEELKTFHLPPGFKVELIAAEPAIPKPMNLAFDARGRLWVSGSYEYPYAAPADRPGRDSIKVLEDTDHDGTFERVTTFVDGLNIPIGLYPYKNGVVAWSIPFIWFFEDTDGDGRADQRHQLYGPLGYERDTHGMDSSFTRGFDGWLYATHGFNNHTVVQGKDGWKIQMNSGNTYRIRLDGSRVEHFTWGQVNPFGMCLDAYGNIYTADCHSRPIYQLVRGGYYPSFGKPNDGLGFGPALMRHSHGSTAIAGIVDYQDNLWPEAYRNNAFVGNVMTSRVNRDTLVQVGSFKEAREEPDFMRADDPWFRPVNLQLGPDGGLYIADFYNRIIGHYEVPLDHPGRDRKRGRIWRVTYDRGRAGSRAGKRPLFDLTQRSLEEVIGELASPNLTRRLLATHYLVDQIGPPAAPRVAELFEPASGANPVQRAHGLWVLFRLGRLGPEILGSAAEATSPLVRTHAMHVLAETPAWTERMHDQVLAGLKDSDPNVRRAAADAVGLHPSNENVRPLLAGFKRVAKGDAQLRYTLRIALRNQLAPQGNLMHWRTARLAPDEMRRLADVALGIRSEEAGRFLVHHIREDTVDEARLPEFLRHAAALVKDSNLEGLVKVARQQKDIDFQLELLRAVERGVNQRGIELTGAVSRWGTELAMALLNSVDGRDSGWTSVPVAGMPSPKSPWFLQKRRSADGDRSSIFLSSLPPGGERLTGILRSAAFKMPARLTFYLAGHDGFPDKPAQKRNEVRLREKESGRIVARSYAPRSDVARKITWNLERYKGRAGFLELVDGNNGPAFAWLAAGRFEPGVVRLPELDPRTIVDRQIAGCDLLGRLKVEKGQDRLRELLLKPNAAPPVRAAAARALLRMAPEAVFEGLAALIDDSRLHPAVRELICNDIAASPRGLSSVEVLANVLPSLPLHLQRRLARGLAGQTAGVRALIDSVRAGKMSARVLLDMEVKNKLGSSRLAGTDEALAALTKDLPPMEDAVEKLIEQTARDFEQREADARAGQEIFTQACAICHQISRVGGMIGPQLDGIGNRGKDRLIEDILDPNRNVDQAFRTQVFTLKSGDVVVGLPRREEGAVLILANAAGAEVSLARNQIIHQRLSEVSLMPSNFGEILGKDDLLNLLGFLMRQTTR